MLGNTNNPASAELPHQPGGFVEAQFQADLAEDLPQSQQQEQDSRLRRTGRYAAKALLCAAAGSAVGLVGGYNTDAHLEIGGFSATAGAHLGQTYNEVHIDGSLLWGRRASNVTVAGEPLGATVNIAIGSKDIEDPTGNFDPKLLAANASLFSDTKQIVHDVEWAIIKHDLEGLGIGAAVGLGLYGLLQGYRRWRQSYNAENGVTDDAVAAQRRYHQPERTFAKRVAFGLAALSCASLIPSSENQASPPALIQGDPFLANTPLADVQIGGWLSPGVNVLEHYIEQYVSNVNTYYDQLVTELQSYLAQNPVTLPQGDNIATFGFVTDRHCNIGMDRVDIALLKHYGVDTLIMGGDDAFSGSFSFESACTRYLAERSKHAGIKNIAVKGNHDSSMTMKDESEEGIRVLDGSTYTVDGITFIGNGDPRSSRYGQGIVPSSDAEQAVVLNKQAEQLADTACHQKQKLVAIAHDPLVGQTAIREGCGNIVTALDGHTHQEGGPNAIVTPEGTTGYQYTGPSAGGAPAGNEANNANPLTHLTIGSLNHDASIEFISLDKNTSQLVGVTRFTFTPDSRIQVHQKLIPDNLSFSLADGRKVKVKQPKIDAAAKPHGR